MPSPKSRNSSPRNTGWRPPRRRTTTTANEWFDAAAAPAASVRRQSPVTGDSHPEGCNHGTNPADARDDTTASVDDDEASDDNPDDKKARPTLTFNQDTREGQGNEVLTQYQEAMDRIVDNRTPR